MGSVTTQLLSLRIRTVASFRKASCIEHTVFSNNFWALYRCLDFWVSLRPELWDGVPTSDPMRSKNSKFCVESQEIWFPLENPSARQVVKCFLTCGKRWTCPQQPSFNWRRIWLFGTKPEQIKMLLHRVQLSRTNSFPKWRAHENLQSKPHIWERPSRSTLTLNMKSERESLLQWPYSKNWTSFG